MRTWSPGLGWVILTMGDRPEALARAIESIEANCDDGPSEIVVLVNGATADPVLPAGRERAVRLIELSDNVGIPGGRAHAVASTTQSVVLYLDDDAQMCTRGIDRLVTTLFDERPELGAVSFRIVDEAGETARRHVPRVGRRGAGRAGEVATFLGGACAIRRSAYEAAGGYWEDLWYGHEELDLAWRMIDAGYRIRYEPEITVVHPRTEIGRHARGWHLTGRNRIWIARRNLPWPLVVVHAMTWLVIGLGRAPKGDCRRAYLRGWRSGWSTPVDRRAISWRTVWRLTRLGRPPVI